MTLCLSSFLSLLLFYVLVEQAGSSPRRNLALHSPLMVLHHDFCGFECRVSCFQQLPYAEAEIEAL